MDIAADQYSLIGLDRMNVVLGRNGCGKSTLLKHCENFLDHRDDFTSKYVTPERGGTLDYEARIETTINSSPRWLKDTRRVNQFHEFKHQSVVQFKRLELAVLRECELQGLPGDFQRYVDQLNHLLDNIELRRNGPAFSFYARGSDEEIRASAISSGESEVVALAIESLMFAIEAESSESAVLFLDEPDVHLHPDLQHRLIVFLDGLSCDFNLTVLIATHSTAMLGALSENNDARVAFMRPGETELQFDSITEAHRAVLPVFGAHPLSNVFNESPALLVEGEDDLRIWQQAVRTSEGNLCVYPVECGGVSELPGFEEAVQRIAGCIYENPVAYSLRDRDSSEGDLDDLPPVIRLRLACRAAENLLLTDDVLCAVGVTWDEVVRRLSEWIGLNPTHPRHPDAEAFEAGGFSRKDHDVKNLRMLLVGEIFGSTKPWEVLVGQAIGRLSQSTSGEPDGDHSLRAYLGEKAADTLFSEAPGAVDLPTPQTTEAPATPTTTQAEPSSEQALG